MKSCPHKKSGREGLTLVEMIVVLTLQLIFALVIASVSVRLFSDNEMEKAQTEALDNIIDAADRISRFISLGSDILTVNGQSHVRFSSDKLIGVNFQSYGKAVTNFALVSTNHSIVGYLASATGKVHTIIFLTDQNHIASGSSKHMILYGLVAAPIPAPRATPPKYRYPLKIKADIIAINSGLTNSMTLEHAIWIPLRNSI